jgi:peptidoglycan/LPS O-acetylase OafA/YrhL
VADKHDEGLDGLRAVAIAAVIGFHYTPRIVTGGSLGVDIFFVLSGWLITSLLLREADRTGGVDYGGFLKRRFLRLTPPLAALLVAYVLLAPLFLPRPAGTRWFDAAMTATYLTNLRQTFWPANNPLSHTWFLALQGQFYLVWPPILLALRRLGRGRAALVLLVAWLVLTVARFVWQETVGGPGAYYFTPLHATGLLLGSAMALRPVTLRWSGWSWIALAVLAGLLVFGQTSRNFLYLQPIAEWAALVVVTRPPRALAWQPLPFLGKISYGIYLWHVPFMWVFPPRTWTVRIGLVLASILAGWLSHILLERPLDRRRTRRAVPAAQAP